MQLIDVPSHWHSWRGYLPASEASLQAAGFAGPI
jgi:hypothetical protein